MSETLQWIIIGVIMAAAVIITLKSRRSRPCDTCSSCELKSTCNKAKNRP